MISLNPSQATAATAPAVKDGAASAAPADTSFAEHLASARITTGPRSPVEAGPVEPAGDQDTPPAPPPPPDRAQSVSGPVGSDGGTVSAILSAIGISPGLARIIQTARENIPTGATLRIFSTERGSFLAKFSTDPGATITRPPDPVGPPPPPGIPADGSDSDGLIPPPPPGPPSQSDQAGESDQSSQPVQPGASGLPSGPPPAPAIPPDEVVLEEESDSESESPPEGPPGPPSVPSLATAPQRSAITSAYEAAADGVVNPAAGVARQPVEEQA